MFYSHEVLTSRKYGVATVWLVATLGSKSSLKKLNRKTILEVNISKACETILMPEAPMALRLQSNLLYGASRVYSQQCGYVLADAQNAHNNMRAMLRVIKTAELDPEAGRARPDQLVLEDDPTFLPEFALAPLEYLDINASFHSQRSSSLTPRTNEFAIPGGGLHIPTSNTGGFGDIGGSPFQEDEGPRTNRHGGSSVVIARDEDDGFLPEADFSFDADGNLLEFTTPVQPRMHGSTAERRPVRESDTAAVARVRREHEEGIQAGAALDEHMDIDIPFLGDDFALPQGETWSAQKQFTAGHVQSVESEDPSLLGAPQRRKPRAPRVIPIDDTVELRNGDLSRWNTQYLENMTEALQHKLHGKAAALAKRNAEYWIFGRGINGVGAGLGVGQLASPLNMFAGDALFEAITGSTKAPIAGQKRTRESGADDIIDDESRRFRPWPDTEVGRGDGVGGEDEGGFDLNFGDVEVGRTAPSALDDQLSAMPWNMAASIRGSSVTQGKFVASFPPSAGGPSSFGGLPESFGARSSRLMSASPLLGRERPDRPASIHSLDGESGEGDFDGLSNIGTTREAKEFELFGPAAAVNTQTAAQTQWLHSTLNFESLNFLEFVKYSIDQKKQRVEEKRDDASDIDEVLFEELLPPATNNIVVGAQGLLHVLALATKGLLFVRQNEPYRGIRLRIVQ